MAAVPLTPITSDRTGIAAWGAGTAATAGTPFTFANSGTQVVRIKATAADTAVTAAVVSSPDGNTVSGKATPALTSSTDIVFGPFPTAIYGTTVSLTGPTLATTTLWVLQYIPTS